MPKFQNGLSLMTPYRSRFLAAFLLLALAVPGMAAEKLFFFSHKTPFEQKLSFNDINVRPNHSTNQHLFIKTPREMNSARVELRGPDGKVWAKTASMKFDKTGVFMPVVFLKAEEKKPADDKKVVPVDPAAAAKAPVPPPPPGKVIAPTSTKGTQNFLFDLCLIEERTVAGKLESVRTETENISIVVLKPEDYLSAEAAATKVGEKDGIKVVVKPKKSKTPAFNDGTPSVVTLTIPPQDSLNSSALGAGTYRRTIQSPDDTATLEAQDLPINDRTKTNSTIRFYIDVDGYQRAFVFEPTQGYLKENIIDPKLNSIQTSPSYGLRFYPGNTQKQLLANNSFQLKPATKPEEWYPIRLELDNVAVDRDIRFIFDRGGQKSGDNGTTANSPDEVETLKGARDFKVWLEPAGDEGQMIITNTVSDWVIPVDTYQMRGPHKITLEAEKSIGAEFDKVSSSATLVLDDTVPHSVRIIDLPDTQVKGQPMKLFASVLDKETAIKKVIFFVGPPPGPDGKRPADPIKVEGFRTREGSDVWSAEITLPPEAKGIMQVGLTATNDVGLEVTETKNIKLVDAPPPAGNLHVKVLRGNRPQVGVSVKLKDGEGKEKATGVSNAKGVVEFNALPPGVYSVSAAKPDSGVGSKAEAAGKVEVEKTTEVNLNLRRGNP